MIDLETGLLYFIMQSLSTLNLVFLLDISNNFLILFDISSKYEIQHTNINCSLLD